MDTSPPAHWHRTALLLAALAAGAAPAVAASTPAASAGTEKLFVSSARTGTVTPGADGTMLVRLDGVPFRARWFDERPGTRAGLAPLDTVLQDLGYRGWRTGRRPANLTMSLADGTDVPVTALRARVRASRHDTVRLDMSVRVLAGRLPTGTLGPARLFIDGLDTPTLTIPISNFATVTPVGGLPSNVPLTVTAATGFLAPLAPVGTLIPSPGQYVLRIALPAAPAASSLTLANGPDSVHVTVAWGGIGSHWPTVTKTVSGPDGWTLFPWGISGSNGTWTTVVSVG